MNEVKVLRLSTDEAQLVAQLLKADHLRLTDEINHTDRRDFREFLKHREILLDGVLEQLKS